MFKAFAVIGFCAALTSLIFSSEGISIETVKGLFVGAFAGLIVALVTLKIIRKKRESLLETRIPLFIEQMILLVESGHSLQSAYFSTVEISETFDELCPLVGTLKLVKELAESGLQFQEAMLSVSENSDNPAIRHMLFHLDMSTSTGGEIIPSLRALGSYSYQQWKVGLEEKVKKLENTSVVPLFVAVIGLMFLVAAVPLVPLSDFSKSLKEKNNAKITAPATEASGQK